MEVFVEQSANKTKKLDGSLDALLFPGNGRDMKCHGILTRQGISWNQSETRRTAKKLSGVFKRAKICQMGDFQRRRQSSHTFSRLWERLKLFWTSHTAGYLMEPIRDNKT